MFSSHPAFAQWPYFFDDLVVITTNDLASPTVSTSLKIERHHDDISCLSGPKNASMHLLTYTDVANNTIKIYCQWNPWIPDGTRQYIAFYNDKVIVGLCPYESAANRHDIYTDAETGEIERTHWLSIRTNGTDFVTYNNFLG